LFIKVASFLNAFFRCLLRIAVAVILFVLLATIHAPGPLPPDRGPAIASLELRAVPLDPRDPARRRLGALLFRRGWVLTSDDPRFGGISAMHVDARRVVAISDTGMAFGFALPARPGSARVAIVPLKGLSTEAHKEYRDSESMAVFGSDVWLGFEGQNKFSRYRRLEDRPESSAAPALMRRWPGNSGPESLVRLDDGRFLTIAEGRDDGEAFSAAVLFDRDPTLAHASGRSLRYRRVPGCRPTDAAQLPDGRLLILNRCFSWLSWLSAALVIAEPDQIRPGGIIAGQVIADLKRPLTVDNMEALSVVSRGAKTLVYIASDNNLMPIQRTLFLEFELAEAPAGPGRRD
jgi:hypothetical protein